MGHPGAVVPVGHLAQLVGPHLGKGGLRPAGRAGCCVTRRSGSAAARSRARGSPPARAPRHPKPPPPTHNPPPSQRASLAAASPLTGIKALMPPMACTPRLWHVLITSCVSAGRAGEGGGGGDGWARGTAAAGAASRQPRGAGGMPSAGLAAWLTRAQEGLVHAHQAAVREDAPGVAAHAGGQARGVGARHASGRGRPCKQDTCCGGGGGRRGSTAAPAAAQQRRRRTCAAS